MPIIADPIPVFRIYSGVKRKVHSSHIERGNPIQISPDNEVISGIQENISDHTRVEEAIGQYVKTNDKFKGICHATRIPIVNSTPSAQQIHSEVKRQVDTTYVDTDDKLFSLIQESYQSSRYDYDIMNHSKRMEISILRTGMVPNFNRDGRVAYNKAIKNQ